MPRPHRLGDGSEETCSTTGTRSSSSTRSPRTSPQRREPSEDAKDGKEQLPSLYDKLEIENRSWLLPPQQLQPRNLRLGIYRFGRRPVDMYRRIFAGINGTPMGTMGADARQPERSEAGRNLATGLLRPLAPV